MSPRRRREAAHEEIPKWEAEINEYFRQDPAAFNSKDFYEMVSVLLNMDETNPAAIQRYLIRHRHPFQLAAVPFTEAWVPNVAAYRCVNKFFPDDPDKDKRYFLTCVAVQPELDHLERTPEEENYFKQLRRLINDEPELNLRWLEASPGVLVARDIIVQGEV